MQAWLSIAQAFAQQLHLYELTRSAGHALVIIAALFVLIGAMEKFTGGSARKYATRSFCNDLFYTLFYAGGFYQFWMSAVVLAAISPHLQFLNLHLFTRLPVYLGYPLYWVCADFLAYWIHRYQHHNRFLWTLHSIHHAPQQLTFLTSYRNHIAEQLLVNVAMSVPLLVLGVPLVRWMPLYVLQAVQEAMQHAELPWSFGPLYRWLVSPLFHHYHHSLSPEHCDRNFGKIFSVWDHLFGTKVPAGVAPTRYGIPDVAIPESLLAQTIYPLQRLKEIMRPAKPFGLTQNQRFSTLTSADDSAINPISLASTISRSTYPE